MLCAPGLYSRSHLIEMCRHCSAGQGSLKDFSESVVPYGETPFSSIVSATAETACSNSLLASVIAAVTAADLPRGLELAGCPSGSHACSHYDMVNCPLNHGSLALLPNSV